MACQDKEKSNNKLPRQYARARTHTHVRFSCINILPTSHCTSHGQTTAEAMHHCSPALLKRRVNVTQHLLYSVTRCGRLWGDGPRREQSDGGEAGHYHYHCLTFLQGFAHFLCEICSRLFPSCEFLKTYFLYNGSQTELETEMCYQYTAGPTQLGVTD